MGCSQGLVEYDAEPACFEAAATPYWTFWLLAGRLLHDVPRVLAAAAPRLQSRYEVKNARAQLLAKNLHSRGYPALGEVGELNCRVSVLRLLAVEIG